MAGQASIAIRKSWPVEEATDATTTTLVGRHLNTHTRRAPAATVKAGREPSARQGFPPKV